jgi:ribonuclease D
MPAEHLKEAIWVDSPEVLGRMVEQLSSQKSLAVDTESNSLYAYQERVCLVQFSTPEEDYLVDPLKLEDLSALGPLFERADIQKVFHAAEYDLICLRRDFGFSFQNLFDTMHAARVLGYTAVGLDKLLGEKFGIHVDKRHQKADWSARPLSDEQIHYARFDTHYLLDLRDVLEQELREKGRWELALEDFERAARADEPRQKVVVEAWERFSGRRDLSVRELTILSALLKCRERLAKQLNRPLFKVIEDEKLIAIARAEASTPEQLAEAGLSDKQIRLWGKGILAAVEKGVADAPVERKPARRPNEKILSRIDKLKNWRKKMAQEIGVESDIVLPKAYVQSLADEGPRTLEDLHELMSDSPWRFQQYGKQILKVLSP